MAQRPAIVVSELFPPAIGGSAALMGEIYSRVTGTPVLVVTDHARSGGRLPPGLAHMVVRHRTLGTPYWGILQPRGWGHHLRTAAALARIARRTSGILHCARVLPEGLWAWMANRLGGVPFVCWSHGEDATSARASREYQILMPRIYTAAGAVLANSHNTARIVEGLGVPARLVSVVHPGVDPVRFSPEVDGAPVRRALGLVDKFVLLTVARVERRKGHDLVLQALAKIRDQRPEVHYVIVGSGTDVGRLRGLAEQLRVADRVTWAGNVSSDELPAYYAACDLFVHPNREEGTDIEGFGLVFLEAAASGRPAIGGRSGGVSETMIEGETGVLVSGLDADELTRALEMFTRTPAMCASIGRAARDRVSREFTWTRAAEAVSAAHTRLSALP